MKLDMLEKYVSEHPESREVLSVIAARKRNRKEIDVSRLIRQLHASQTKLAVQDIMQVFEVMQDAELGRLEKLKGGRIQFNTQENILQVTNSILQTESKIANFGSNIAISKYDAKHLITVRAGKLEILVQDLQEAVELVKRLI